MVTYHDLDIMVRTVHGEARGEPRLGKVAVAHVILNRARAGGWFGGSIAEVCLKPHQFSCWLPGDPNRAKIEFRPLTEMRNSADAALQALIGEQSDPTGGANHYHADYVTPNWAVGREPTARIGRHLFFKL